MKSIKNIDLITVENERLKTAARGVLRVRRNDR